MPLTASKLIEQSLEGPPLKSRPHLRLVGSAKSELVCRMCKATYQVEVSAEKVAAWLNGELIQSAMPHLEAPTRELFISGTCGKCWDNLFGED